MTVALVEDIRRWLRDTPEKNPLLEDNEFSTDDILLAIKMAVAAFNETPIRTSFEVAGFPYIACLFDGVAAFLYEGASVQQARSHLPYATGGVQVDDMSHSVDYAALASNFRKKFNDETRAIKNQMNLEAGWGSIGSPYVRRNR